jgi:hypothetical protein
METLGSIYYKDASETAPLSRWRIGGLAAVVPVAWD